jgi:hypothetical protein
MTTALLLAACVLAAPPPKPAADNGRITLWVGDKLEHFPPDGTDAKSMSVPGDPPHGVQILPDRSAYVTVDLFTEMPGVRPAGPLYGKLTVTSLVEVGNNFALDEYECQCATLHVDGSQVYFMGRLVDKTIKNPALEPMALVLDLKSKAVRSVKLPENHRLSAVAPGGRSYATTEVETNNKSDSVNTYLVTVDGKAVEIFMRNVNASQLMFSPDGLNLLARTIEVSDSKPAMGGGFRPGGLVPSEYVILNTSTRVAKPWKTMPADGNVLDWAWSPDGKKVAYVWSNPGGRVRVPKPQPGVGSVFRYEYKVFVADADGSNPKEVYTTKGTGFRAFMWH